MTQDKCTNYFLIPVCTNVSQQTIRWLGNYTVASKTIFAVSGILFDKVLRKLVEFCIGDSFYLLLSLSLTGG